MVSERIADIYDAVVIGGSYAGMAAAMQLARARRRVLVVDAGLRRNRFAAVSHGFLGQDGNSPAAIAAAAKAQLLRYPNVAWHEGAVLQASRDADGFLLEGDGAWACRAQKLVLATGVVDELPGIDGLSQRWGRSVFHCPYCHGYELNEGRIGVLGVGPLSVHQALMLPDWGQVTFFVNDALALDDSQLAALAQRGVTLERQPVAGIEDTATVVLTDGRRIEQDGLFVATRILMASPVAAQLGCAFDDSPMGPYIRTDATKATSVSGVFACGDAARPAGNVSLAVGDGALAGAATHRSLMFG